MPNSPLEISRIIAEGRQEAERTLAHFIRRNGARLQTREWVFPAVVLQSHGWLRDALHGVQPNRLIHGDGLLTAAALLAGDAHLPSLRGRIELILIDPQLDAKTGAHGHSDGMDSYLAMITPRLVLMRELLSPTPVTPARPLSTSCSKVALRPIRLPAASWRDEQAVRNSLQTRCLRRSS